MIQRFIELGEGYSDLYELIELTNASQHRVEHLIALHTTINSRLVSSLVTVLSPTKEGEFQPIYICREGIPNPHEIPNKRFQLFEELSKTIQKPITELDVKPSTIFAEKELYYQYLIGILRLQRLITPMK
ncbi:methylthioribose kinase [Bacillus spongiae]|uniref:Methylthioribose kinase n=1 Tax=Bacillus spongiae TaxID=2683610 RepID=A0ABU8H9Q4_9BACI